MISIPGLSTLKTWALGLLAVGSAVLFGLWKASQLGRIKDKVEGIKRARATERRVNNSIVENLQREQRNKDNRNYTDDSIV